LDPGQISALPQFLVTQIQHVATHLISSLARHHNIAARLQLALLISFADVKGEEGFEE